MEFDDNILEQIDNLIDSNEFDDFINNIDPNEKIEYDQETANGVIELICALAEQSGIPSDEYKDLIEKVNEYTIVPEKEINYEIELNKNGMLLKDVPEDKINDNLVKIALKSNGNALQFVKTQTQEHVDIALKNDIQSFKHVDEKFKTIELCKKLLKIDGMLLQYSPMNDELIDIAINNNGLAIKDLDKAQQTNKRCIVAVTQNGAALEHIHNQTNYICCEAITNEIYTKPDNALESYPLGDINRLNFIRDGELRKNCEKFLESH